MGTNSPESRATERSTDVAASQQPALDLFSLVSIVLRRRTLVISCAIVGLALGILAAVLMTPTYRASVLVAPVEDAELPDGLASVAGQLGGLASIAGIGPTSDSSVDQNLAILRSRDFAMSFVADLGLVPVLFADDWDPDTATWRADVEPPTEGDVWEKMDEDVRQVSVDRGNGMVTVSIEWSDREIAAEWANLLVSRINARLRARAIDEATRSLEYLNRELEKTTNVGLRQAIYRMMEQQINKIMLANVRDEFAFTVLDPAVAPEADDFFRPNRPVLIILGPLVGVFMGAALAVFMFVARGAADAG
jgi:uncharacterized protein involved in exopolysaccharide biosynthesis